MTDKPEWDQNFDDWTDRYIAELKWTDKASAYEKLLVAGNIKAFSQDAKAQLMNAAKAIKRAARR